MPHNSCCLQAPGRVTGIVLFILHSHLPATLARHGNARTESPKLPNPTPFLSPSLLPPLPPSLAPSPFPAVRGGGPSWWGVRGSLRYGQRHPPLRGTVVGEGIGEWVDQGIGGRVAAPWNGNARPFRCSLCWLTCSRLLVRSQTLPRVQWKSNSVFQSTRCSCSMLCAFLQFIHVISSLPIPSHSTLAVSLCGVDAISAYLSGPHRVYLQSLLRR